MNNLNIKVLPPLLAWLKTFLQLTFIHHCYISFLYCLFFYQHRGLLSQHKDGVDSYVSLMLLPDKSKATKKKTGVKKRDLNPEFNERLHYLFFFFVGFVIPKDLT